MSGPDRLTGAWVENREISDARIEGAIPEIKALFHEYDENQVLAALTAAGINGDPATFSAKQLRDGAQLASALLVAERRRRQEELLNGG